MSQSEAFIDSYNGQQREIMRYFHNLLTEELGLTDKIRFKIPFYYGRSWICYLNPIKDRAVELVFVRGRELSNVQGILSSKGRKMVLGIEFEKRADIPESALYEIFQEALLLDETTPYTFKKKKRH